MSVVYLPGLFGTHILTVVALLYGGDISSEHRFEYSGFYDKECKEIAQATDYKGAMGIYGHPPITIELKADCHREGAGLVSKDLMGDEYIPFFEAGGFAEGYPGGLEFIVSASFGSGGGGGGFSFGGFPPSGGTSGGSGGGGSSGPRLNLPFVPLMPTLPVPPPVPPVPIPPMAPALALVLLFGWWVLRRWEATQ